jgi:hypothetical protein
MCFVHNFVDGAFASRKVAKINLAYLQPQTTKKLKIVRAWCVDVYLYYIVY